MRSFCEALTAGGRTTGLALIAALGLLSSGCRTPDAQTEAASAVPPPVFVRVSPWAAPAQTVSSQPARTYDMREFGKCAPCHALDERINGIGPHMVDIYGRRIGSVENYPYSDALKAKEGVWDAATLDSFLANPRGFAPGTKMIFRAIENAERRAEIIAYLQREAREGPQASGE